MHYTNICSSKELRILEYIKSCTYSKELDAILCTILYGDYYNQWVAEYTFGPYGLNGFYWGPSYDTNTITSNHNRVRRNRK